MSKKTWPEPKQDEYLIRDFRFKDGGLLPELNIHYRTLGKLRHYKNSNSTNAVLLCHGSGGSSADFFQESFAGQLLNPGQPLSAEEYFIIVPDQIGHGQSSKPSDGLRARFPRYCYSDMVQAIHILLTERLGISHLRLVMGVSMGGMLTWVWGTQHPDFMSALMPLASLPTQIAGRNRMWRKHAIESIRNDPEFNDGNYKSPPRGLRSAVFTLASMGASPLQWQKAAPDWDRAGEFIDKLVEKGMQERDANDFAYAFDASWDYNPQSHLKNIKAPLTAVNSADDQMNPPELGILESEMKNVADGKAVVLPITEKTIGHATFWVVELWVQHLVELLDRSGPTPNPRL